MKVDYLELRSTDDIETMQTWLDSHSTATITFIKINGFTVYIFYTEAV